MLVNLVIYLLYESIYYFSSFVARPGKCDEPYTIITSGHDMSTFPGCRKNRVFGDSEDAYMLWIFETWDSKEVHEALVADPVIKE